MALLLPRSLFVHIPKTGGIWVRSALQRARLPMAEVRHLCHVQDGVSSYPYCCQHSRISSIPSHFSTTRLSFTFVRNPLTYYQSYWAFKMRTGWHRYSIFDRECAKESFHEFVSTVLEKYPGWVSGLFRHYVEEEIGFVGKMENLEDDLITALSKAGEEFDENVVRSTPYQNQSSSLDSWVDRCTYTQALEQRVWRSEQWALEQFGYV